MIGTLLHGVLAFFHRPPGVVALDVVDILIVAFLIYRALLVMKGTRAVQLTIVVMLVGMTYQVARMWKLVTLFAVLDNLITYAVLILVVVFQNDIRRGLLRILRRPFFFAGAMTLETHVLEEVIKVAQQLAQKRIGALIVFERDATLDEFIDMGTILNAQVSKELLYSVFVPSYENPMHDGAAIIRDGRVWQAGAFLPLTTSAKLDKTLGTRHRAAIGITEETDAVVVVVSEERGSMSLCFNGNMVRNLDANSLREALSGLFSTRRIRTKSEGEASIPPPPRKTVPPPSMRSAAATSASSAREETRSLKSTVRDSEDG